MVEESAEDLTDGGRYGIARSSRRSSPLRHVTSNAVARLLWFGGGRETNRCESRRRTTLLRRRLSIFRALYGPVGSGRLGWAGPGQCSVVGPAASSPSSRSCGHRSAHQSPTAIAQAGGLTAACEIGDMRRFATTAQLQFPRHATVDHQGNPGRPGTADCVATAHSGEHFDPGGWTQPLTPAGSRFRAGWPVDDRGGIVPNRVGAEHICIVGLGSGLLGVSAGSHGA
jgi:hypothetical protein